jgi:DNA-binding NarL/FixJ family response regulator
MRPPSARRDRGDASFVVLGDEGLPTAKDLAALLDQETDIEVVGVAGDVKEALRRAGELCPSVVLCDVQLQGEAGGFEILRRLRDRPGPPAVVLFISFDYPAFHQRALDLGAAGYLPKTAGIPEIVAALRHVASGGTAFATSALQDASHGPRPPSDRDLDLIRLVRSGHSNDEVSVHLGIGTRGVESSLRRLFGRYGVLSRTDLVTLAEMQGWLALPSSEPS